MTKGYEFIKRMLYGIITIGCYINPNNFIKRLLPRQSDNKSNGDVITIEFDFMRIACVSVASFCMMPFFILFGTNTMMAYTTVKFFFTQLGFVNAAMLFGKLLWIAMQGIFTMGAYIPLNFKIISIGTLLSYLSKTFL
jgi:hypothetical protein